MNIISVDKALFHRTGFHKREKEDKVRKGWAVTHTNERERHTIILDQDIQTL